MLEVGPISYSVIHLIKLLHKSQVLLFRPTRSILIDTATKTADKRNNFNNLHRLYTVQIFQ